MIATPNHTVTPTANHKKESAKSYDELRVESLQWDHMNLEQQAEFLKDAARYFYLENPDTPAGDLAEMAAQILDAQAKDNRYQPETIMWMDPQRIVEYFAKSDGSEPLIKQADAYSDYAPVFGRIANVMNAPSTGFQTLHQTSLNFESLQPWDQVEFLVQAAAYLYGTEPDSAAGKYALDGAEQLETMLHESLGQFGYNDTARYKNMGNGPINWHGNPDDDLDSLWNMTADWRNLEHTVRHFQKAANAGTPFGIPQRREDGQ